MCIVQNLSGLGALAEEMKCVRLTPQTSLCLHVYIQISLSGAAETID